MNEEKKNSFWKKTLNFLNGKGFYIVLFLCVAAIGISGYVVFFSGTPDDGGGSLSTQDSGIRTSAPALEGTTRIPPVTSGSAEIAATTSAEEAGGSVTDMPAQTGQSKPPKLFYVRPLSGPILREYSDTTPVYSPTMQDWRVHTGVDFAGALGAEVVAVATGEVTGVGSDYFRGVTVTVLNADGTETRYCGLGEDLRVKIGQNIAAGAVIGTVGETAVFESADEPHIHLEMLRDGKYIDPLEILP